MADSNDFLVIVEVLSGNFLVDKKQMAIEL